VRILRYTLLAGGVALGIAAYKVQMDNLHVTLIRAVGLPWNLAQAHAMTIGPFTTSARSWAIVIGAWLFLVAGLVAWSRRPSNRLGPLMAAAGIALLLRQLRYSHDAFLFTVFFVVGELSYWVVAHAVFAYPSGRITDRWERALIKVGYTVTFLFTIAILLLYEGRPLRFFDPTPRDSLISVGGSGAAAVTMQKAFVIVVWGVLAVAAIVLLIRKLVVATPRARRILAPLLLAAITVALRAVFESVFTFAERPSAVLYDYLFWWQISAFIALPVALLAGLLRARLARASVGDLVLELERTPPQGIRAALRRALDDPTLEVLFWLPERNGFVDAAGSSAELPSDHNRSVTRLEHGGETLAALVHDPSLLEEPKLVEAAGAAARLALENARLHAETRAQLEQVRESRVRIVTTADEERRRIERDIHDGAQQRLVALAVQLRSAQRRLKDSSDPEVDGLLAATVEELKVAVEELRELARGVHPAILTEDGLAAALESLVSRIPFPVDLDAAEGRLPAQVEATAYFVACEALANVVKHARASTATVRTVRRNGLLVVEVEDDGIGGAVAGNGSGLRGLADRVEALGGRLRVESPAVGGTRIVGEIPCAS
jgi:signal transduction histidine kinase